ncbi:MAG: hypothetical protein AVDCRST_MAG58-2985 [uncultured Rubrobacteraceae bacterium]|uniref:Uncharacterized protein n=1 Tax=uncultured Rubrobacteraceae bacterium TaxID=349277 RepID=A0A6J4R5D2_9ACTN|nr:MAG: hypothetical protein AVDCRST_MAG58-2985 [uncultured Rubrobacteraceae bacterium]
MLDVDTFLTTLYVIVDNFCQSRVPAQRPAAGPEASLSSSEVVTLAIFARWSRFASERDFYRYAQTHLREAFPTLPNRSQFNRSVRHRLDLIEAVALDLVEMIKARRCPYEALDSSAVPIRDAKRRGEGWLPGYADVGWSNSLGWYEGFPPARCRQPGGGDHRLWFRLAASTKDQPLAKTFFAARHEPNPRLPSVGSAAMGPYVTDKGFEGEENHRRWLGLYGAGVICPPKQTQRAQEDLAQALEALGGEHPPGHRERLGEAPHHLRSSPRATPRPRGVAGTIGSEGSATQLLYLAQRTPRPPPAGFRRLAGMVISTHTKRLTLL